MTTKSTQPKQASPVRHYWTAPGQFSGSADVRFKQKSFRTTRPDVPTSPRLRVEDELVNLLGTHPVLCEGRGFDDPKTKGPQILAQAEPASPVRTYNDFLARYFLETKTQSRAVKYLANTGNARPSLFDRRRELKLEPFCQSMGVKDVSKNGHAWLFLLADAVVGKKTASLNWIASRTESWFDAMIAKREERAIVTLADKHSEQDVNRAHDILYSTTKEFLNPEKNLQELLRAKNIRSLSPDQKFWILTALMKELLYTDGKFGQLKSTPDFEGFVARFNQLRQFPTLDEASSESRAAESETETSLHKAAKPRFDSLMGFRQPVSAIPKQAEVDYEKLGKEADSIVEGTIQGLRDYLAKQSSEEHETSPIDRLVLRPFGFDQMSHNDFVHAQGAEQAYPESARDRLMADVNGHLRDDPSQAFINLNHLAEAYMIDEHYLGGTKLDEIKVLMKDMALSLIGGHEQSS